MPLRLVDPGLNQAGGCVFVGCADDHVRRAQAPQRPYCRNVVIGCVSLRAKESPMINAWGRGMSSVLRLCGAFHGGSVAGQIEVNSSINFDAVFADTQPSFIACSIAPFSALSSRARATRNSSESGPGYRREWNRSLCLHYLISVEFIAQPLVDRAEINCLFAISSSSAIADAMATWRTRKRE